MSPSFVPVFLALFLSTWAVYVPPKNIGHPAGLIPECPGVTKNASISSATMPYLQIVYYKADSRGKVIKKTMPITEANKMLLKEKHLDFTKRKTVFYALGFWDSTFFLQNPALAGTYVRKGYNVLMSETFSFLTNIYPKSARLSYIIGKKIGEFLANLSKQGLKGENLELVGISLGAHIVSYAANRFEEITGEKPSRITGLDPAGPCFRSLPPTRRLDPTDAENVDVIHTNIDGFGIAEPLGHVDIYVNGGEFQPGDIPYIPCLVICSHLRSFFYFWQALEHPKKFIAVKCDSVQDARDANCYNNTETNYLGLESDFDKPGIYYLATSNEFPYFRGKEGLKAENEIYTSTIKKINAESNLIA